MRYQLGMTKKSAPIQQTQGNMMETFAHEVELQERPIDELADLLSVTPDIARELLHTLGGHTTPVNGTPVAGGAR